MLYLYLLKMTVNITSCVACFCMKMRSVLSALLMRSKALSPLITQLRSLAFYFILGDLSSLTEVGQQTTLEATAIYKYINSSREVKKKCDCTVLE